MAWTELLDFIANSPGAPWDSTHAQEIINNLSDLNLEIVTGTLGSTAGVEVTLTERDSTNYILIVTVLGTTAGDIGEITYTRDSTTAATIYNSGSNDSASFVAAVLGA